MRKRLWYLLALVLLLVMGVANNGQSHAKAAEGAKEKQKPMEVCLYLGQHIPLADLPEGTIVLSQDNVIELSEKHVATAVGVGKVVVSVDTGEDILPYVEIEVKENEILAGLSFHQQSFSKKTLGGGSFTLPIPEFQSMNCVWRSENTAVATVTEEGVVTPVAPG